MTHKKFKKVLHIKHNFTPKQDAKIEKIEQAALKKGFSPKRAAKIGYGTVVNEIKKEEKEVPAPSAVMDQPPEPKPFVVSEPPEKPEKKDLDTGGGHQHKIGLNWCASCEALIWKD